MAVPPSRWILLLLVAAALSGCASRSGAVENQVSNPARELKAGEHAIGTVDVRPVATHEVEPDFPPELGSILSGKALVVFTVRADGKVVEPSVLEADDVLFGEAAVRAVSKWRFRPAEIGGKPVDCRMTLPFVFDSPYGGSIGGGGMPDSSSGGPPAPPAGKIEAH